MEEYMRVETIDYKTCPMCRKRFAIKALSEEDGVQYINYRRGRQLIQEALPDWSPFEREALKTGYCPKCQSLLFGRTPKKEELRRIVDTDN